MPVVACDGVFYCIATMLAQSILLCCLLLTTALADDNNNKKDRSVAATRDQIRQWELTLPEWPGNLGTRLLKIRGCSGEFVCNTFDVPPRLQCNQLPSGDWFVLDFVAERLVLRDTKVPAAAMRRFAVCLHRELKRREILAVATNATSAV